MRAVAQRVVSAKRRGNRLVVVVSAMGDTTDDLVSLAEAVVGHGRAASRHGREMDMLLTSGERISIALLAMAIREAGEEAVSLTGSQAAIITDNSHTRARITEIRGDRIRECLERDQVVIVAGFQGVSSSREITTLGRGGSDTSAVAIAAALKADRCEVYSDVAGVFTADPRKVSTARIVPEISYDELLELASGGAQVMHARAVEIAAKYNVDLRLGTAFADGDDTIGTLVTRSPKRMEELALTGIAAKSGQAKLVLRRLPAGLSTVTALLVALAEGGVSIDMVSEASEEDGRMQLLVSIEEESLEAAERITSMVLAGLGGGVSEVQRSLSRIVLVGSGMHQRPGVFARAFRALLDEGIDIFAVSTSGITISVLVKEDREQDAVRALHDAFTLDLVDGAVAKA